MATRIRKSARGHLYIEEHIAAKDLSIQTIANRIGVVRQTVFRWIEEQHRLDPGKIAQLAEALGLEHPEELWHPPGYSRLDDMTAEELRAAGAEILRRLSKQAG